MRTESPGTFFLKNYTPPAFKVEHIDLRFHIYEEKTFVRAVTEYQKITDGDADLFLNGEDMKLLRCRLNGQDIVPEISKEGLIISNPGKAFTLEIETEIDPAGNTKLEGLYKSGTTYCTQCEAEGFRRITYYQDRPDVMAPFTVRIEADQDHEPVLLSNGNLVERGQLDDGRHFAVYDDPYSKPCYLFALFAGDVVYRQDSFTTMSGKVVDLRIYTRPEDEGQTEHAMISLKKSMEWDEEKYGREYNYNRFDIVAVSDFNMGAMENTSLNIFNTALVLAHPDTATDTDYQNVEGFIVHEYFHNWTGNRITCRDWFQLSLKEGLTVFRDQQFSGDMHSEAVQRIEDVMILRRAQFPEDAGPLAHPVRPDQYIEINNFYTVTVYNKGAEVIRMIHTILGPENFRKAMDLYFDRHDGQAVTCEDFVKCMEDASGEDLSQFWLWYIQAGTPEVTVESEYDESARRMTLTFTQDIPETPDQSDKKPMHIPIRVALLDFGGNEIQEKLLHLKDKQQTFVFDNIEQKPVPSILRNFTAPVKLITDLTDEELRFLMVHDKDGFNQWDSVQKYTMRILNAMLNDGSQVPGTYIDCYGQLLDRALDKNADKALMARAIIIPAIADIGQEQKIIKPSHIHDVRNTIINTLLDNHEGKFNALFESCRDIGTISLTTEAMGRRALKNSALLKLINRRKEDDARLLKSVYDEAECMTDRIAAVSGLAAFENRISESVLDDFYKKFESFPLVVNKWFAVQASAPVDTIFEKLNSLRNHKDFNIKNPNIVRSLYGAFAMNNPVYFHDPSGRGYEFLKDAIIELNDLNPQIAARLVYPFRQWRRYTQDRQEKMKVVLEEIAALKTISPDVYEMVKKTLG